LLLIAWYETEISCGIGFLFRCISALCNPPTKLQAPVLAWVTLIR
jgi:hypothetical protein